jgi:hypothetical protein
LKILKIKAFFFGNQKLSGRAYLFLKSGLASESCAMKKTGQTDDSACPIYNYDTASAMYFSALRRTQAGRG